MGNFVDKKYRLKVTRKYFDQGEDLGFEEVFKKLFVLVPQRRSFMAALLLL